MRIRPAPQIDIYRGHGQVPLRHAIRITLGWAVRGRETFFHSLLWGLAFGFTQSFVYAPNIRASIFFPALWLSFAIGYLGPIPWRWRLVPRSTPFRIMFLANGLVSFAIGYFCFFTSLVAGILMFMGRGAISGHTLHNLSVVSLIGFVFSATGLYIVTDQDHARAARRAARRNARHERLAEEARMVALRAQINPHFFFNSLNTIAALIPTRPHDAERAVELLAEALRPALMRDQPMLAPLSAELEVTRAYAEIEKLRLGDRARFEFVVEEGLEGLLLPSLSLQPLVENAVRHGAARTSEPYRIRVEARRAAPGPSIAVVSCPEARLSSIHADATEAVVSPAGHALHNIAARTRALLGAGAALTVRTAKDYPGAVATLSLPPESRP